MSERVTVVDCRRAGFCMKGVREFCAVHGIDFRAFVRDGYAIEDLAALDDANAARAAEIARARIASASTESDNLHDKGSM